MKRYNKLQIIHKHGQPDGIRYEGGFLFFFPPVHKYQGQEDRYRREIQERYELADYLLAQIENPDTNAGEGE